MMNIEEMTDQALNDIGRDELDHDNVHAIVYAMLEAGYRKDSEFSKAIAEHNDRCVWCCNHAREKGHCDPRYNPNVKSCPDCPRDWMIEI
jgi:hypothetical protein